MLSGNDLDFYVGVLGSNVSRDTGYPDELFLFVVFQGPNRQMPR
jgi:hypothetical protein